MNPLVVCALVGLAFCDGAMSGFRSSAGRSGLVDHRDEDRRGCVQGLVLLCLCLTPTAVCFAAGGATRHRAWGDAAAAMLTVYLPFGALVLLALSAYATLHWRRRFLAMALVLGPFTWARPWVGLAGAVLGARAAEDPLVRLGALLALLGVLAVEPLCDRLFHRGRTEPAEDVIAPAARGG